MVHFSGRKEELEALNSLLDKNTASLAVIYGRRRIGKSRLVEEFGKDLELLSFAGLAPTDRSTNNSQLEEFSRQISRQLNKPLKLHADWGDAFFYLADLLQEGRVVIFFDEITWMGACDKDFLGKLKNAWDTAFKKNNRLILILCGSVSAWIKKNILSSTGFHGRVSLKIRLKELSIPECEAFWNKKRQSKTDILKILSVTGAIPKYLEEIRTNLSADENIKQLCFNESGILFNEFKQIFIDMLQRDSDLYRRIVEVLVTGSKEQSDIAAELNIKGGGTFSDYLEELETAGFIKKYPSWNLLSGTEKKIAQYQLSDNYLRFYLKYILPNRQNILEGNFKQISMTTLPAWATIMSLQFENLVLNNRMLVKQALRIYPDEIICDNPYLQRQTKKLRGCQIDYLIQTRFGNLYLCEVKFSRNIIKKDVIEEVQEKMNRLSIPQGFSIRPVLIHAGEVHDSVVDSQFFYRIINFTEFI